MVKYQILTHLPCTAQEYIALKDRSDYKDFQLEIVGAREHSNTRTVEDGWVTQVIINKPDIKFPAMLKPLLRGKEIIFTDKRRYRERQDTLPHVQTLSTSNNITDRVTNCATLSIDNVTLNASGEVVSRGAPGDETCEVHFEGEVTVRLGWLSGKCENAIVQNMRNAYGRFPDVVRKWKDLQALNAEEERLSNVDSCATTPRAGSVVSGFPSSANVSQYDGSSERRVSDGSEMKSPNFKSPARNKSRVTSPDDSIDLGPDMAVGSWWDALSGRLRRRAGAISDVVGSIHMMSSCANAAVEFTSSVGFKLQALTEHHSEPNGLDLMTGDDSDDEGAVFLGLGSTPGTEISTPTEASDSPHSVLEVSEGGSIRAKSPGPPVVINPTEPFVFRSIYDDD